MSEVSGNTARWGIVSRSALFVGLFVGLGLVASIPAASAEFIPGPAITSASEAQQETAASGQHEEAAAGEQGEAATQGAQEGEGEHAQEGEHAAGQGEGEGEHASEGEHGEAESHGMPWREVIFRWINFCLLVALMYWVIVIPPPFIQDIFSFPGLRVVMASRSGGILSAKALAERQQTEAEQILSASADRLAKIEVEVGGLIDQAHADGAREARQAEEDGQGQAERIRDLAGRELRAEATAAQRKLREHVAELAVGMAEKLLKENLSPEDQQRLVNDYISRLGERVA